MGKMRLGPKWPQLEGQVQWLLEQRAARRRFSTPQLRLHAQVVAETMNMHAFAGGYNWCHRFMRRNSFSNGCYDRSPSLVMDELVALNIRYITNKINCCRRARADSPSCNPSNDDNPERPSTFTAGILPVPARTERTTTVTLRICPASTKRKKTISIRLYPARGKTMTAPAIRLCLDQKNRTTTAALRFCPPQKKRTTLACL